MIGQFALDIPQMREQIPAKTDAGPDQAGADKHQAHAGTDCSELMTTGMNNDPIKTPIIHMSGD